MENIFLLAKKRTSPSPLTICYLTYQPCPPLLGSMEQDKAMKMPADFIDALHSKMEIKGGINGNKNKWK